MARPVTKGLERCGPARHQRVKVKITGNVARDLWFPKKFRLRRAEFCFCLNFNILFAIKNKKSVCFQFLDNRTVRDFVEEFLLLITHNVTLFISNYLPLKLRSQQTSIFFVYETLCNLMYSLTQTRTVG